MAVTFLLAGKKSRFQSSRSNPFR